MRNALSPIIGMLDKDKEKKAGESKRVPLQTSQVTQETGLLAVTSSTLVVGVLLILDQYPHVRQLVHLIFYERTMDLVQIGNIVFDRSGK